LFLLCGLGNKGAAYKYTRHNAGYLAIERFSERLHFALTKKQCGCRTGTYRDVLVAKPDTFMNLSGGPVSDLMTKMAVKIEDLVLVHDDLDIELGKLKIKWNGRDGGHKGVRSVVEAIQSPLFHRIKIGIGRDLSMEPEDYVLSPFRHDEAETLSDVLDTAADAIHTFLFEGKQKAMSMYNR
jgi:peptidyl-tRNA hydrolase, PTH1 family